MKWYTCAGSRCHSSNQLQKGPIPQVFQGNFPSNRSHLLSGALSTHLGTLFFTALISFRRLMLDAFKAWRQYPLLMKKEREREERRNQLRRRVAEILPDFQTWQKKLKGDWENRQKVRFCSVLSFFQMKQIHDEALFSANGSLTAKASSLGLLLVRTNQVYMEPSLTILLWTWGRVLPHDFLPAWSLHRDLWADSSTA